MDSFDEMVKKATDEVGITDKQFMAARQGGFELHEIQGWTHDVFEEHLGEIYSKNGKATPRQCAFIQRHMGRDASNIPNQVAKSVIFQILASQRTDERFCRIHGLEVKVPTKADRFFDMMYDLAAKSQAASVSPKLGALKKLVLEHPEFATYFGCLAYDWILTNPRGLQS